MANIAPTKTNLIKIRQELQFARQGYDLLDQKRNILIIELLNLVDQCVDHQQQLETALEAAYKSLEQAVLHMGKLNVCFLCSAINMKTTIKLGQRRIMGVSIPIVDTDFQANPPYYSPANTSFWIDDAVNEFRKVLIVLGKLAELKISVLRLADEVRRTIRKVNALEKIAIPQLSDQVRFIQHRLEENERDAFVLMKKVKERLEQPSKLERE
ncbi:V-type ATP synthase subunit D [candidate division KSB1 bacterium]|nr:V-type ATP synthase subunit D [candidate division KSB1 bacterium]